MPLLDHFHEPLYPQRSWESFHSRWANSIADALQEELPQRYVAEVQIHLGSQVEADVAEFEAAAEGSVNGAQGNVGVTTWAPPVATLVLPASFPDSLQVQVRDQMDDARLVGVLELVSPRNKDRADSRRAFAMKMGAYLQRGIGVIAVDIVTNRHFNLHNELVQAMEWEELFRMAKSATLYAVAYRPVRRSEKNAIEAWPHELSVDGTLPQVPLALRGGPVVAVDLEATYSNARQRSRL